MTLFLEIFVINFVFILVGVLSANVIISLLNGESYLSGDY